MKRYVILLISLILIFHFFASIFNWYRSIPWLDIPMHLIGGVATAALFFYLFSEKYKIIDSNRNFSLIIILSLSFLALIGVLWEFYEYLADVYLFAKHPLYLVYDRTNLPDLMKDLFDDLLGGLVFSLAFFKKPSSPIGDNQTKAR